MFLTSVLVTLVSMAKADALTDGNDVGMGGLLPTGTVTSVMVVCRQAVARGVNPLATNRRNRWCSSPSMLTISAFIRSHSGPEVTP